MMSRTLLLTTFLAASIVTSVGAAGCQQAEKSDGKFSDKGSDKGSGVQPDSKSLDELNARVKALEETNAKNAGAMEFLAQVYGQQKAQRDQEEASEPAPDAVFAVDLGGSQVDGPKTGALVTIIEAWDFA